MEQQSTAPKITRSSHLKGGSKPGTWQGELVYSAKKTCENCGAIFRPWMKAGVRPMRRGAWEKQRFCSISCSKEKENAMWVPGATERMTNTLRKIGHHPKDRFGNGHGMTKPQQAVLTWLGAGWIAELSIATGASPGTGLPRNYKPDIAHPEMKIAIELDGASHSGKRLIEDRRKDNFLTSAGWKVFRVKNKDADRLCSTLMCPDTLLTTLAEFSYIIAILCPGTRTHVTASSSTGCAPERRTCASAA